MRNDRELEEGGLVARNLDDWLAKWMLSAKRRSLEQREAMEALMEIEAILQRSLFVARDGAGKGRLDWSSQAANR